MRFKEKISLIASKYNLNIKWRQLKFGYQRAEIECDSQDSAYAVYCMLNRHKGVWCKWAADGYTVFAMDPKDHKEISNKLDAETKRVNDWWERYHLADDETRRLMAYGAIE